MQRCYPVKAGQFVLMHAAAGGVGLLAGQWGKHLGARMIGVAGGADKVALAKANGYSALTAAPKTLPRASKRSLAVPACPWCLTLWAKTHLRHP